MTYIFRPGHYNVRADATISQPGGAAAGNGLLNSLIAYWPGNEAAGNALDLHTNALTLNDMNVVTSNPGLVYPLARQYTRASNNYHTRPGDDALLSVTDLDFTLAAWIRMDGIPGLFGICGKFGGFGQYGYALGYWNGVNRFFWTVSTTGADSPLVSANTLGMPVIGIWYLIVAWHDSVGDTINIQINNAGVDSAIHAGGAFDSTHPFEIGRYVNNDLYCFDGRIGPTMFWKSNPGLGGVLTAAQRTSLYNAGAGLPYAAFTV